VGDSGVRESGVTKMTEPNYEWARAEARALARSVNPDDLPAEFKLPKNANRLDIFHKEGPKGLAARLYAQICRQNIQYDLSPFNLSEDAQSIRKPSTILAQKRGTCLDLAVLFAAMCLDNDLLPVIVVVEGHAFVGLSLTRTCRDRKKAPQALAWDKGKLTDLSILQGLAGQEYLFIECTGAAQSDSLVAMFPEGRGREHRLMSFERACEAGHEQLTQHTRLADSVAVPNQRTFLYALDIHTLQMKYGFKPIGEIFSSLIQVFGKVGTVLNIPQVGTINIYQGFPFWVWLGAVIIAVIALGASISPGNISFARWVEEWLPSRMTGQINIAIADFGDTEAAKGFTEAIVTALQREIKPLTSPFSVQFRRTGPIKDYTQAKQWAREHNVTLLIWGYLSRENPTTYAVQFYIHDLREGGEIADQLSTPSEDSKVVKQRVEISVMFAKGLVYLFMAKPSEAADQFEFARQLGDAANQTNSDPDGIGSVMDTLYFYEGRALAAIGGRDADALAAYQQALKLNPDYTWAHLGIGNLYFKEALSGVIDLDLLDQAWGEYQAALNITNSINLPPASAYVTAKAHVNIGNVFSIRAEVYKNQKDLETFAAMATAAEVAYQAALTEYEKAVQEQEEAVPARYPAKAHYGLGVIYELQGQMVKASKQYEDCQELVIAESDPDSVGLKDLCEKRLSLVSPTSVPPTR
jgi:tetratricopeptide (TPR) repeat protein